MDVFDINQNYVVNLHYVFVFVNAIVVVSRFHMSARDRITTHPVKQLLPTQTRQKHPFLSPFLNTKILPPEMEKIRDLWLFQCCPLWKAFFWSRMWRDHFLSHRSGSSCSSNNIDDDKCFPSSQTTSGFSPRWSHTTRATPSTGMLQASAYESSVQVLHDTLNSRHILNLGINHVLLTTPHAATCRSLVWHLVERCS